MVDGRGHDQGSSSRGGIAPACTRVHPRVWLRCHKPIRGRCLHGAPTTRNPGGALMAGTTRVPKAELTGVYGAMVKRMSRKMLGEVPEPVEVAWHNRKVLNFSFALGRRSAKWDQCDESLKTFAHMAVASL